MIKKDARISFSETLISYYQGNPSLWDHNAAEYHTNANKDFLLDLLHKELNEKFTCEEIVRKWKSLVKIYKQENSKVKHKPSGSGTKDIYISTWEFFPQLHFLDSICDDTDATVDSIMDQTEAKSRKRSRVAQRDEREDKKLKLLARAVDAINTPPPSVSQTPLVEKSESMAFGNYVALTLAKLTPGQFRRAKKLISDVLFDMEEKDGIEQAGSCPRSFPQHTTIGYVENYGRPVSASSASSNQSVNSYYQSQPLNAADQFRSYSPLAFQNNEGRSYHDLG